MTSLLSEEETAELSRELTEAQRLEFRRRVDVCYAVWASLAPLVYKRGELAERRKDAEGTIGSRNAIVVAIWGGPLVYWLGDMVELSWLKVVAAVVGLGAAAIFAGKVEQQYVAGARLREVEQAIGQLRFHWLATGAHPDEFDAYCALVAKLGDRPEWDDSKELDKAMRAEVLRRVSDLGARVS